MTIKQAIAGAITLTISLGASSAYAADATLGLDLASAYVFRGATLNENFVAQPTLEVAGSDELSALSGGVWANFDLDDDDERGIESGQFSEVDFYVSYELPLQTDPLSIAVGYSEYMYPTAGIEADRELNAEFAFDAMLNPTLGVFVGLDGGIEEQIFCELSFEHEAELNDDLALILGAGTGFLFASDESGRDDGISFAKVSAGLAYGLMSADLTYYFETDEDVQVIDTDLIARVGLSGSF